MKEVRVGEKEFFRSGNAEDFARLTALPPEQLGRLFFTHIRNLWRVDGLYFLGIEKRAGTETAVAVDVECWRAMAAIEARDLREALGVGETGVDAVEKLLPFTSWYLDHAGKRMRRDGDALVLEILDCRTQLTRVRKSLPVFPCRPVREGYLQSFAEQLGCACACEVCPPGERDGEVWCRWRFTTKELR
jgi:hypothetical protein